MTQMILVMTGHTTKYLERLGIALSVLLNVLLGGYSGQTFSARNWEWHRNNKPNLVVYIDMILGEGHCMECWAYWKVRRW